MSRHLNLFKFNNFLILWASRSMPILGAGVMWREANVNNTRLGTLCLASLSISPAARDCHAVTCTPGLPV